MSQSAVRSSVGSASLSCRREGQSVSSSLSESLERSEGWLSQFLDEMESALPYKRHRLSTAVPCQKRQKQRPSQDWEWVFGQLSARLSSCLWQRGDMASIRACRRVSRACRLAFSCAIRGLTIRDVTSKQIATALSTAFKHVTTLHVSHHIGPLHSKLRRCTQLRELFLEPVHSAGPDEHQLSSIGPLSRLERLKLWGPIGCTSAGLRHLTSLTNLASLSLGSKLLIRGSDLHNLAWFRKLQVLELVGCMSLDDHGLSVLSQFSDLKTLRLRIAADGGSTVTATGIQHIGCVTTLRSLELEHFTSLTESDLSHLAHLVQLTHLKLNALGRISYLHGWCAPYLTGLRELSLRHLPSLGDAALSSLSQLTRLMTLHVGDCPSATDATAASLCTLPQLEDLKIDRFPWLTEQGLDMLLQLASLKTLKVTGVYSISGDALCDAVRNNGLSFDLEAWRHQIILLWKRLV